MADALDPRRLLVLRAVVRAGSISQGARELGWTQPAVTKHIQSLESVLGVTVLVRTPRGVVPTAAGNILLAAGDAIAAELATAVARVQELGNVRAITIAAFPSAMAGLIPDVVVALRAQTPSVHLSLHTAEPPEAVRMLVDHEADLAVTFAHDDVPLDDDLVTTELGHEPLWCVLPAEHALANQPTLTAKQLAADRWIAGCSCCHAYVERKISDGDRSAHAVRDVVTTTDDAVAAQSFVATTGAVTVLPQLALARYLHPDVAVVPLQGGSRRIVAQYLPTARRTPALTTVLDALRATPLPSFSGAVAVRASR